MNQLRELTMKYEGQNKSLQNKVNELQEKLLDLEVKISEKNIKKGLYGFLLNYFFLSKIKQKKLK